jgi:hypothetical protein
MRNASANIRLKLATFVLVCIMSISLQSTLGFMWSRKKIHNAKMEWSTFTKFRDGPLTGDG